MVTQFFRGSLVLFYHFADKHCLASRSISFGSFSPRFLQYHSQAREGAGFASENCEKERRSHEPVFEKYVIRRTVQTATKPRNAIIAIVN